MITYFDTNVCGSPSAGTCHALYNTCYSYNSFKSLLFLYDVSQCGDGLRTKYHHPYLSRRCRKRLREQTEQNNIAAKRRKT